MAHTSEWLEQIDRDGYTIIPGVFGSDQVEQILCELTAAIDKSRAQDDPAIRGREGVVYAARNVLSLWPAVAALCRRQPIPEALHAILGPNYGLVRVLYFDKPPERSWSLPWHKDMTIAVRDNSLPSAKFTKPTRKAGVPHVEAPLDVLESMLTARVHLDDVTAENGPMRVLPGSHRSGKRLHVDQGQSRDILVGRGDVLLIRPLVAHSSANSDPQTRRHRRILHFEFASSQHSPDGYEWHDFVSE